MANFRPTADHWVAFTQAVVKQRVFEEHLQLAGQQALWQFANVLPIMDVDKSTQAAKENAVFNMIYINFLRIIFAQMLGEDDSPVFSMDFLNKLAALKDENDAMEFVSKEFIPIVKAPKTVGANLPSFSGTWEASGNLMKYLYRKVNHFEL